MKSFKIDSELFRVKTFFYCRRKFLRFIYFESFLYTDKVLSFYAAWQ